MREMLKTIFQDTDSLTIAVTICLAIIGWLVALWLQNRNTKAQHKIQIRYEIYKQFVHLHKETQDLLGKLGASSHPPFILMESSMIPFQLNLQKEYKGMSMSYTEQECLFEGEKKWISFTQELYGHYSDFSEKFIQLMYITEDWEAALEPLLSTKKTLNDEVGLRKNEIHKNFSELQSYSSKHTHDWRTWDRAEVEKITQNIQENAMTIGMFLSDFMVLIHNELLSSYFGHKRPTRKTLDPKYKVLTKDGIVENVDTELVSKMDQWKNQLAILATQRLSETQESDESNILQSIVNGVCPECKTDILILESETTLENTRFKYACGHSYPKE